MKTLITLTASLFLIAAPLAAQTANTANNSVDKKTEQALKKQERQAAQSAKRAERQAAREARKAERKAAREARLAERKAQQARNQAAGKGKRADPLDPANALAAKAKHTNALLERPDIHGVGVSWKSNGEPAIKVYIDKRVTKELGLDALPKKLDGVSVVAQNSGPIYALNVACEDRKYKGACMGSEDELAAAAQLGDGLSEAVSQAEWHERPVPIGISIGSNSPAPGTLGCRVSRGCHSYALTSSHIVANGDEAATLMQPGAADGGIANEDTMARLLEATQIILGSGPEVANRADAAIFDIESKTVGTATRSNGYGAPRTETVQAALSLDVMKYGRSTAMTSGYIDAIDATVIVNYPEGEARFVNQLVLRSKQGKVDFALPGDSGALVVAELGDNERKPVGLLFASGKGISVANPIDEVLFALDVEIDGDFE